MLSGHMMLSFSQTSASVDLVNRSPILNSMMEGKCKRNKIILFPLLAPLSLKKKNRLILATVTSLRLVFVGLHLLDEDQLSNIIPNTDICLLKAQICYQITCKIKIWNLFRLQILLRKSFFHIINLKSI